MIERKLLYLLCWMSLMVNAQPSNMNYASEHLASGQKVSLRFDASIPPEINQPLTLSNGLTLTFANIISLGDLYGIVGEPITLGQTENERQKRFLAVFHSLATNGNAVSEASQLTQGKIV